MNEWEARFKATQRAAAEVGKELNASDIDAKVELYGEYGQREMPDSIIVAVGLKPNHVLERTLNELSSPPATPLPVPGAIGGIGMGANVAQIPGLLAPPCNTQ